MKKAEQEEVKVELCYRHKDTDMSTVYPGFVFNGYLSFPSRSCKVPNCEEDAFYTLIGLKFPDAVGEIKRQHKYSRGAAELYREAKTIMDGGSALSKLTNYLRTRVIPSTHKEVTAEKLLAHYAQLVLTKLGIAADCSLSDRDKHRILVELGIYPEEISE